MPVALGGEVQMNLDTIFSLLSVIDIQTLFAILCGYALQDFPIIFVRVILVVVFTKVYKCSLKQAVDSSILITTIKKEK